MIVFIFLLFNSGVLTDGARQGLMLWSSSVIPALFPYMVISSIMINYSLCDIFCVLFYPLTRLYGIRKECAFCIFSGLLFGYPMCAANASAMYQKGLISRDEADFLACAFNIISPAFICTYVNLVIFEKTVHIGKFIVLYYIIILLSTMLIRHTVFRRMEMSECGPVKNNTLKNTPVKDAVMSSVINITKIGGYIVIFCIIAEFLAKSQHPAAYIGCSFLEVTTGTLILSNHFGSKLLIVLTCMSLCFGGICGIFQTAAVTTSNRKGIKKYIYSKIITTLTAGCMSYLAVYVIKLI